MSHPNYAAAQKMWHWYCPECGADNLSEETGTIPCDGCNKEVRVYDEE